MEDFSYVGAEELLKKSKIPLEIVDTEDDIYHDMARLMFEEIERNNVLQKNTVFIVPVGPVFQYRRFARLAKMKSLDCSKVYIFNMDEYMLNEHDMLPPSHPLSFHAFMNKEFYQRLEGVSEIPLSHRFFPEPGNEGALYEIMQKLGGVDIAFGGIGICGHIAFNEVPLEDDPITDADFSRLPTRILKLTKETRTINSVTNLGGYIDGIPKWCITLGMKEILSARKIRFYMNREWQKGIVRKICLGPVSKNAPASFFQTHPDAKLTIASYVADAPGGIIR